VLLVLSAIRLCLINWVLHAQKFDSRLFSVLFFGGLMPGLAVSRSPSTLNANIV
jgi:hypothetical protein